MSPRIVATPLAAPLRWPLLREGAVAPALLSAIVEAPGTAPLLEALQRPGALVVTTGQQPGLLGGPLFVLWKALSAAALARRLAARWQRPVVPVFWVAGDDHDFAEANHTAWFAPDGQPVEARLRERPADAPLTPMWREPVGAGIVEVLARFDADHAGTPHGAATSAWLRRHWQPDVTLAAATAGTLAELLAPHAVLVLDSTHRAVKEAARPHLLRALERAEPIERCLGSQHAMLVAEGRDPGVPVGDGATLVMLEGGAGRDRLVREGAGFRTRRGQEPFTLEALRALAAEEPQRFSPNVLLRPVVESALLPTVAYVAGPGELRYLALTPPVYESLGVPVQVPTPRWSGVLVEPRVDRVLDKFGIGLEELLAPAGPLETRLVRSQLPTAATEALARLRARIEEEYALVEAAAVAIDPTLERPVRGARHGALGGTQEIEKKLVQHLRKRQETELQQLARARAAVRPLDGPQERVLGLAGQLARGGPAVVAEVAAAIDAWVGGGLEAAPGAA